MGKQEQDVMDWVLEQQAELCENILMRYGVELNPAERSAIGDVVVAQITAAIARKSRG